MQLLNKFFLLNTSCLLPCWHELEANMKQN
jgi:hypothetical protein